MAPARKPADRAPPLGAAHIVGVDTGGTFTDIIHQAPGGGWSVLKLLSTPHDPSAAVLEGLRRVGERLGGGSVPLAVVHGSTVATNALLERTGARTALVTNRGFEDLLVIGRQNRPALYDLNPRRQPPLVPGELRLGLPGRIASDGRELEPLDPAALAELADRLAAAGVESVAVALLFSFASPGHERAVGHALACLGVPVSLSHQVLAEFREFERTSTTVVNAYVAPRMHGYIGNLQGGLGPSDSLRIMQSSGGSIFAATARAQPVRTILSGPAGGAVGALELGRMAGCSRLITFDMGGTSTDVALIDGRLTLTTEAEVAGLPVRAPMLDIHTVGAGGGSLAEVDAGGALCVGPRSAGAAPGPICYGRGGAGVTVTDANLFLGRLIPERFLGGAMRLAPELLERPFAELSGRLGLSPLELAEGVVAIANAAMERAIRVISVERGHDPRGFTLFSFGGAGGLHAAELARLLSIPRVLIPRNPGILSAVGMLLADVVKDYSRTVMLPAQGATADDLRALFSPLEAQALDDLAVEGAGPAGVTLEPSLDMRYAGQSFELMAPLAVSPAGQWPNGGDVAAVFHALHAKAYGHSHPERPVEVVTIRLRGRAALGKPEFPRAEAYTADVPQEALLGVRPVVFGGRALEARVIDREALLPGNALEGPAVLVEYSSTILLPPGASATVDAWGNLLLDVSGAGS